MLVCATNVEAHVYTCLYRSNLLKQAHNTYINSYVTYVSH